MANKEKVKQKTKNNDKKAAVGFEVIVREFQKDKVAMTALVIFIVLILAIFISSLFLNSEEVMKVATRYRYAKPGTRGFILGADEAGREILYLLILGARNSLLVAVAVTALSTVVGLIIGVISGYYGGIVDSVMMRITDFMSILPSMLFIIAFLQVVEHYGVWELIVIISLFAWTGKARLFRGAALSESSLEYIQASKTLGSSDLKIMVKELLPNISSIVIVNLILTLAGNIGLETGLSYLGFGFPSSTPSLGTLIGYASSSDIIKNKMWIWVPAALLILVLMLCINYMGQAFQRALDSKQRLG